MVNFTVDEIHALMTRPGKFRNLITQEVDKFANLRQPISVTWYATNTPPSTAKQAEY